MPTDPGDPIAGLGALRRSGAITELLFVNECATVEPTQLRPIAERLGLTVQAASYSFRQLKRRGLVEQVGGRYRPTVRGVAWLHETLDRLGEDVRRMIEELHVIRSARAVALDPLRAGDPVSLELVDGLLSARRGAAGASRGRATGAALRGESVEVSQLEGIVPIAPATVSIRTFSAPDPRDRSALAALRRLVDGPSTGLFCAEGLEAYLFARRATDRPVIRFAVASACREASQVGVPSLVLVHADELPRLLAGFAALPAPPVEVLPLVERGRAAGARGH